VASYPSGGPKIAVVGDSITWFSHFDIEGSLSSAGYSSSVTGLVGQTTIGAGPSVRGAEATRPSVLIVELGTNDVAHQILGRPDSTFGSYRRRMKDFRADAGSACFVVTTIGSHRATWDRARLDSNGLRTYNRDAATYNTWLHATFPRVVDWDAYEWAERQKGVVLLDKSGLHPNAAGRAALGRLDLAAVRGCLAR
jgi:lysophospholipase L1-like esterase